MPPVKNNIKIIINYVKYATLKHSEKQGNVNAVQNNKADEVNVI